MSTASATAPALQAQLTRVLLIEDTPADAFLAIEQLRHAAPGVQCMHVETLAAADPVLLAQQDCVLLDLSLPDAQGLDGLREIRHRNADVPIVVLTSREDLDTGVLALRHGAQDYLLKSAVDGAGLERAIRYAIERMRAAEALARAALHDPLTSLLNRAGFFDRLEHALERCKRSPSNMAVLFCDLDHFKAINDSLGHLAGDQLIAQAAARIQSQLRPEDTLGRLGGDEFVALLEDLNGAADAETVSERIVASFDEPFLLAGQRLRVGVSIGRTHAAADSTPDDLLRDADAAMYVAKRAGRGRSASFVPEAHASGGLRTSSQL